MTLKTEKMSGFLSDSTRFLYNYDINDHRSRTYISRNIISLLDDYWDSVDKRTLKVIEEEKEEDDVYWNTVGKDDIFNDDDDDERFIITKTDFWWISSIYDNKLIKKFFN